VPMLITLRDIRTVLRTTPDERTIFVLNMNDPLIILFIFFVEYVGYLQRYHDHLCLTAI
jgi:hypothetical protein